MLRTFAQPTQTRRMERVIGIEPTTFSLGTGIWGLGGRYVGGRF